MMLPKMVSSGCPCFSYMANRKNGSMARTMRKVDAVCGTLPFMRKNRGTPTAAAMLKHTSCRLVRFSATLVFTFVRSLGTVTYAIDNLLSARMGRCLKSNVRGKCFLQGFPF